MPCRFWRILFLPVILFLALSFARAQAPTLVSIAVTPSNASVIRGTTNQFTAIGTYSDNSTQNLTSTAAWSSSAPAVASVNTSGLATGISPGTATVTATLSGISGSASFTVQPGPVNYVYDDLGRLVGVIDGTGNAATYNYDPVGNILSVARETPTQVSIMQFTPGSGPAGTTVTISGTGFNPTPSQNTVQFNGVTATVNSATVTQLVATVPNTATTGPIRVANASGAATSSVNFNVVAANAPTITGLTPSIGVPGTVLTITGTNFDPNIFNNRVRCNVALEPVGSVGTGQTSLTAKIASSTTSGHIYLSTPQGKAVSSQDFFVPFYGHAASDVGFTGRFGFGNTQNVALTANHIGLLLFDAKGGQTASVQLSGSTFPGCAAYLFAPNGSLLSTAGCQAGVTWAGTTYLPMDGTYTLGFEPFSNSGSINVALSDVTDVTGAITIDGPPVTVTTTIAGQDARLNFTTSVANQRVVLFADQITNPSATVMLVRPDGATLGNLQIYASGQTYFVDTQTLTAVGTYQVLVQHSQNNVGGERLRLVSVPPDVTGTLSVPSAAGTTGPSVTVTTVAGQNADLTFNGTAGQKLSFNLTNNTYPFASCGVNIADSSNNSATSGYCDAGLLDTITLATTGTYHVLINPYGSATGSVTVSINNAADVIGVIPMDGPAVTTATTAPGQDARLTFTTTTANVRVALRVTNVTNPSAYLYLLRPDGSWQTYFNINNTPPNQMFFLDPQVLATAGTYTLWVQHYRGNIGSETLQLNSVPPDFNGTITPGGAPVTVTTVPGQNAKLTFNGTPGQQVAVQLTGNTMGSVTVALLAPDGSTLTSLISPAGSFSLPMQNLTATGTYSITITPPRGNSGSITVTLAVPQGPPPRPASSVVDWSNPLAANLVGLFVMNEGSGTTDKNLVGGQVANFSGSTLPTWNTSDPSIVFSGGNSLNSYLNAGTSYNFDQLTPGKMTIVAKVYVNTLAAAGIAEKNDGNSIDSGFVFGWDSTGAMKFVVEKNSSNMWSATAAGIVASGSWAQVAFTWDGTVGTAAASHLFLNGVEQPKSGSADGAGTIGYANATNQPFRIGNAGFFVPGSLNGKMAYLAVYKGRILTTAEMGQLDSQLPIDTSDMVGTIVPNGASVPVTTTASGQNAQLTFSGNLQQATVQLTGSTMGAVTVSLLAPDGTTLTSSTSSASSFSLPAQMLTVAGNYTIYIHPANPGSITVALTTRGGAGYLPPRPTGSVLDTNSPLATNLAGLFVMNESTGATDKNLVDSQTASFSGSGLPTWNTTDPSIVFNGGGSLNSYLDAGTDLNFDQLPTSKITIVAKVYVNTLAAGGVCEKNDGNSIDSGFLFGWDSTGAAKLTVERTTTNMRVATAAGAVTTGQWIQVAFTWDGTVGAASAAHLFVNSAEQTKASASDGSGTIGYANATNRPFRIGNASFDFAGSLNGKMAYLAVYKGRILTSAEMGQLDIQLPIR